MSLPGYFLYQCVKIIFTDDLTVLVSLKRVLFIVSHLSIFFMGLALAIQFLAPCYSSCNPIQQRKVSIKSIIGGVLCFTITQIIIRIPLLQLLQLTVEYQNLVNPASFLQLLRPFRWYI